MRTPQKFAWLSSFFVFDLFHLVQGHGHVYAPPMVMKTTQMMSSPCARIPDPNIAFNTDKFPPEDVQENYKVLMELLDPKMDIIEFVKKHAVFVEGATAEDGNTLPYKKRQKLPEYISWGMHADTKPEGFKPKHYGPCWVLCDKVIVFFKEDAKTLNAKGNNGLATFKLDYPEKCVGADKFTFVWLTAQSSSKGGFQVYVNSVGLIGGNGKGGGDGDKGEEEEKGSGGGGDKEEDEKNGGKKGEKDGKQHKKKKKHKKCRQGARL